MAHSTKNPTCIKTMLFFVSMLICGTSALGEPQLLRRDYESQVTGEHRQFLLYLPDGYAEEPGKEWPVIYFLHGGGERGDGVDDLDYVLAHGPMKEAWIQKRDLEFIIIAPQLPVFGQQEQIQSRLNTPKPERLESGIPPRSSPRRPSGPIVRTEEADPPPWDELGPPDGWWMVETDLISILDDVLTNFRADEDRVYLTGLSYGGFGTFYMAAAHPERWAAIAPIVGTGNPATAPVFAEHQIPIWMFGGGRDPLVRVGWLYEMAQALENAGVSSVRFTVHEDTGHNAWDRVYGSRDIYDWFLFHSRD